MILAAGIALLFTLAGCGSPIEFEGPDAPGFGIMGQKTANNTSWMSSPTSAIYANGVLSISSFGSIAPDAASYAGGIVVREVTSADDNNKVYSQGAQVPVTFLYFASNTAYFSANLNTDDKVYEVYIDATKLTRQGGIKLNGDYDSTPGEEEDGAYVYVGNYNDLTGQRRWTNRTLSIYYSGQPNILDSGAGAMDKLGYLEGDYFSATTQENYKSQIEPKLELYSVSITGSKTKLGAPTLTWVPSNGNFSITPASNISRTADLAYLELVLTNCDQIKSPTALYGHKVIPYTNNDTKKTDILARIQHGSYLGFNYVYGYPTVTAAENSTTTNFALTPTYSYTKLTSDDVIVLRLPKAQHPTEIAQQPTQFQVVTPEIQTINVPGTTNRVAKQVLTIPKLEGASYYYLVAIKYNTPIKTSILETAGYFGNTSPTQSVQVTVPLYQWSDSYQDWQSAGSRDVYIPIPSEYWLWPSILLNNN